MRKTIFIGLAAIGVLTGCSEQVWVKAGMSQAEYQKDSAECEQTAGMSSRAYGNSLDAAQQARSALSRCMAGRGYTLQKADSVDPALKLVNCKFTQVAEIQRLSAESCTKGGGTIVDE
jgi:hypothetical protein